MIEKMVDIDTSGKAKISTYVVYPSDEDIYPVFPIYLEIL